MGYSFRQVEACRTEALPGTGWIAFKSRLLDSGYYCATLDDTKGPIRPGWEHARCAAQGSGQIIRSVPISAHSVGML